MIKHIKYIEKHIKENEVFFKNLKRKKKKKRLWERSIKYIND